MKLESIRLVLAFTLAVSLLAGLLFGLIPVVKYAGPNLAASLRGGGRTLSQSRERHRARNTLVVVQVALALVLLVGSGLMIRTFQALRNVAPGIHARRRKSSCMRVSIPEAQVKEPERVMRMQNEMLDKLAAIPGVTSVAFASRAPLEGFNSNDLVYAEDKNYAVGQIPPVRRFRFISPGFFKTDWDSADRRARFHLDRPVRQAARRDRFGKHGAGDVGQTRRRAGQADPRGNERSVARGCGSGRATSTTTACRRSRPRSPTGPP